MQKLLLAVSFLFFSFVLHAQLDKGQLLIGGSATFSSYKAPNLSSATAPDSKFKSFSLAVGPGYFVMDKLAVGARMYYLYANSTVFFISQEYKTKAHETGVSPFVRYYFLPKQNKINLLADASYSWGTRKGTTTPGTTMKENFSGYKLAAGPVWFITPQTGLELTLSYEGIDDNSNMIENKFDINVGLQIHLPGAKKK